jgi:hypothetical protein
MDIEKILSRLDARYHLLIFKGEDWAMVAKHDGVIVEKYIYIGRKV